MENNKCPKCCANMKLVEEKGSIAWVCERCGYGIATTVSLNPIFDDSNVYSVTIERGNIPSRDNLSLISKITGENYIVCKGLLETGGEISRSDAIRTKEINDLLKHSSLIYSIVPSFKW